MARKSYSQVLADRKKAKKAGTYETLAAQQEDDIAPVRVTVGPNIAPVKTQGNKWFKTGAFGNDDGNAITDAILGIGATGLDVGTGILKGGLSLVEGLKDLTTYGIAGVADVLGADETSEKLKKQAQKSDMDTMFGWAEDYFNRNSFLGETSRSITQGIGQVGGMMATAGLGTAAGLGAKGTSVLATGLMGTSSAGSGMSEAYAQGATDEEAVVYGVIKGSADALSELMFGGLGKTVNATGLSTGLSSADDMLAQKLSSKISNQVAKNFVEFGVKSGAEGFEEIVAGVFSALGKKATYMSEEELSDIIEDEDLLEQFVVGSMTSALVQSGMLPKMKAGSLKEANKEGRDFITGYTQNEQTILDKVTEQRISEQETDGKKLTSKEKNAIKEQVRKDLEKGYIDIDTIESVLGGEEYSDYKSAIDQEESLQKEFDALNKMKQGDMTGEQIDRRAELKEQLAEFRKNTDTKQMKEKLYQTVNELTKKDMLLRESYNEKSRKGQTFEADITKYDTKQQAVIQKAIDSGILNNTNKTHEFVDMIAKISADKGVSFDFTNNQKLKETGFVIEGKNINGYVQNGNVTLNVNSSKALNKVVGHEVTHVLEGTEFYDELARVVKDYAESKGEFQTRYEAIEKLYQGVERTDINSELVADLVGDYLFTDEKFVQSLSVNNRNIFQKIYDEIKYLCKVVTVGSEEAKELEKVKRAFEKAYKEETAKESKETPFEFPVGYSLSEEGQQEKRGNYNVYGKDIALEKNSTETQSVLDDIAPVRKDIGTTTDEEEEMFSAPEEQIQQESSENLTEKDAKKIKNIQAKIDGFKMTKDITIKEFDESIARKNAEYEELKRKDTKKAAALLNQINNLESRKNEFLADIDKKIKGQNAAIENIEKQSRARNRLSKQNELRERMSNLIGDTSTWKDKKLGLQYQTNTLRRNLRDIVRDENGKRDIAKADAIYDELQGKYNHNEALLNKEANAIKKMYKDLKITNAENVYIQMLGEYRHNPDCKITPEEIKEFYEKNKKNIDDKKVDQVIDSARTLYDSLYRRVNEVLKEHGYKEIGYREGYFPHFTEEKQNIFAKIFNWKTQKQDIPTDIAGLTEEFNPQRSWQSFDKHRTGDSTDYNFSKGLDAYVDGALDWIYHIEDIQKRRVMETEIRYRHSDKGLQEEIDKIRNNPLLSADEVEEQIQNKLKEAKNPLGNFLTDFRNATNNLAGKKSTADRDIEYKLNRQIYSTMTNISNRVTANMVAGSVSSALTNFIPITQSWGQVSPRSSLIAMGDTIKSLIKDDGVIGKSDFLTNRLNKNENLHRSTWDKIGDGAGMMMECVDNFTSQTVWRSKYMENIANGMSEVEAIKNADQFAENVIAGRSRGNMPTIYNSKNPITKVFTAFQLEVGNQYGYMFKDMPQDVGNKAIGKLMKGYATMFMGAYAYNALYSSLTGRNAAFDPIRIIAEFCKDLFGDDEEEPLAPIDALGNLVSNVMEEIPYIGGLMGGGRIPISSAIPYDDPVSMISGTLEDITEGNWKNLGTEWLNPVYYLALPTMGGQIRKTNQGLAMFDDDLPISGSYTSSGNLRYSVEETPLNIAQAAVFGQYANKNAQEYFDRGLAPLKEKQIEELKELDIPIREYWDYREGLKGLKTLEEKADYIDGLDFPVSKKNIMMNNLTDRKEPIDMEIYDDYNSLDEMDFAVKNPEKYKFLQSNNITYQKYKSNETIRDAYNWAFENPEKYTVSRAITNDVTMYKKYSENLNKIKADKDANGKSISGSRKQKVVTYINNLDAQYGEKLILFKNEYPSDDTYNYEIIEYLNGRSDMSYEDTVTILKELGFTVEQDGMVRW